MRLICRLGILAAACQLTFGATLARGQFGYYPWRADGGFSADGAWGLFSSAMTHAATANAFEADRLAGERAATLQSATLQSSIRNTQSAQAQFQTQELLSQRQANRDWWFQVQQQQAGRQPLPSGQPASAARVAGFESAPPTAAAADDIIKWPPLLRQPEFAQQRAMVEAPYRRAAKADPTAADYENMIVAVGQMKAILKQMATAIVAQEYLDTDAFLTQLAAEARGRIETLTANPKP